MDNRGFANGQKQVFVPIIRHIEFHAVMLAVFHHNNGVVVANRGFEQPLRGICIGGDDNFTAREMRDHRV